MGGTTSACAENTHRHRESAPPWWNYLRVRGEYRLDIFGKMPTWELPPRARRIRSARVVSPCSSGTTSACAENTHRHRESAPPWWNYLRVRGEYRLDIFGKMPTWELPPRARRIRSARVVSPCSSGTTSACAENTCHCRRGALAHGNYLRVRGEYRSNHFCHASVVELPPRARRIPQP